MSHELVPTLISSAAFALIGMVLFGLAFFVIVKITPFSIKKESEEDHNTALAIMIAAVISGISIIVAAAMHA